MNASASSKSLATRFGLYPHQVEGVSFLKRHARAILADDMGLGKTRQAIVALTESCPEGTLLVICPASLKLNWEREIRLIDPDAAIEVIGVAGHSSPDGVPPRWVIVNYDLLAKNTERLGRVPWSGVIVDEAHFIKNASQRTSHVLKLIGVTGDNKGISPFQVYLLTGTPMPNRPRDLFNLLRATGHPSARSFIAFARRYCGAYRNDYGWVTTGASNLDELNLLLKEVMLRRKKDEVLDLPPKIRSWVPVALESGSARKAQQGFSNWFVAADASRPNDREFLARLTKLRVALHKGKHAACAERIRDVLATGRKVIVFTCYSEGITRHKKVFGEAAVTITGSDSVEQRLKAVDAFQKDPNVRVALCNLIAGGVGITLTAGTHVIFQDLDWVPANHLQAEDRCYRLGQTERVTVEYLIADGTLDGYIANLLETKLSLINAVESDALPDVSLLAELQAKLQQLGPALLHEARAMGAEGSVATRISVIGEMVGQLADDSPLGDSGFWEFPSSRNPAKKHRVTFGSGGHLQCTCEGFQYRGECSHVRDVRKTVLQ